MKQLKKILTFGLLIFIVSYLVISSKHFLWRTDGGIPFLGAQRILEGEQLYKDFFEFWMPGSFYLLAGIFRLFGQHFAVIRTVIFINFALLASCIFLIGKKICASKLAGLLSVLLFLFPSATPSYNHNWLGLLSMTVGVCLLLYENKLKRKPTFWFILGLVSGIVINFIQWQGVGMFLTGSILIWTEKDNPLSQKIRLWLSFILGSSLLPLAWCLFYWWQKNLSELLYATIFFPLTHYPKGNMQQIPSEIWWTTTLFYLLFWWQIKKSHLFNNWGVKVVSLSGTILHLLSLTSPTSGHVALSYAFTSPVFIYFISRFAPQLIRIDRFPAPSFKALFTNRRFVKQSIQRIVTILITFTFLVKVLFNFTAKMNYLLAYETEQLETAKGILNSDQKWSQSVRTIQEYLAKHLRPDENTYVYIGPWSPCLYYFLPVKNPTRHAHLGPEHYTEEILNGIITDLEDKNVQTIVFLPSESFGYTNQPDFFVNYLEQNFRIVTELEAQFANPHPYPKDAIWERNPQRP